MQLISWIKNILELGSRLETEGEQMNIRLEVKLIGPVQKKTLSQQLLQL